MNNYIETLINHMAQLTGTELTTEHYRILEFAYDYYQKNKVGPLYRNLEKYTGASKNHIERLFPFGLQSLYTWVDIPIYSTNGICRQVPTIDVDNYREVYLDYNATTFPRKEVVDFLIKYYKGSYGFGNPSSSTNIGKTAHSIIHKARSQIADFLNVSPKEIIFVSGGSEANNMAIKGVAFERLPNKGHIITSKIEHPSVLQTTQFLQNIGFNITYLDVDKEGAVSPQSVQQNFRKDTILVSIMAANNEIGTINPIKEIGDMCNKAGVPFMVDAVQAFGRIKLCPKDMGISLLTISGHKIYGPKGIGALYVDKAISMTPLIHGGKQEFGLRAGTENVGSILAFGQAAQLICSEMDTENKRLLELRRFFLQELCKVEPSFIVNGSIENRIPHNLSIGFPAIDGRALLLSLNQIGVYVSTGSACSANSSKESHVINAIGVDGKKYATIRFSFGLGTTKDDLNYMFKYLPAIIKKLRK